MEKWMDKSFVRSLVCYTYVSDIQYNALTCTALFSLALSLSLFHTHTQAHTHLDMLRWEPLIHVYK